MKWRFNNVSEHFGRYFKVPVALISQHMASSYWVQCYLFDIWCFWVLVKIAVCWFRGKDRLSVMVSQGMTHASQLKY